MILVQIQHQLIKRNKEIEIFVTKYFNFKYFLRRHVAKSAQKRANTQQFDENMNDSRSVSSIEHLKKETKDYYALTDQSMNGQNGSRHTNRPMNSVEMNINERLFRNDTVLDKMFVDFILNWRMVTFFWLKLDLSDHL